MKESKRLREVYRYLEHIIADLDNLDLGDTAFAPNHIEDAIDSLCTAKNNVALKAGQLFVRGE